MSDLVVVGTVALDDIETPFGKVKGVLGGAGTYASLGASYFLNTDLISIIGRDFGERNFNFLRSKKINTDGVAVSNKTFRWSGHYEFDMNSVNTRETNINCLAEFKPKLSGKQKKAKFLLLANCDPAAQLEAINQMILKPFIAIDTMNYWIEHHRSNLIKVIKKADLVVINEGEARQLFKTPNLIKAGRELLEIGPKYAIIKKGEHGALLFSEKTFFSAPGYPLEDVKDPTGAGDSFLGGLVGYLAKTNNVSEKNLRRGIIYGSVIASFCAEEFGTDYAKTIKLRDIRERYRVIKKIRQF